MTSEQSQKIDQLKKALGGESATDKIAVNPSLDNQILPKKNTGLPFPIGNKFDASKSQNIKTAHDPKGKNKQILKGNSKARR